MSDDFEKNNGIENDESKNDSLNANSMPQQTDTQTEQTSLFSSENDIQPGNADNSQTQPYSQPDASLSSQPEEHNYGGYAQNNSYQPYGQPDNYQSVQNQTNQQNQYYQFGNQQKPSQPQYTPYQPNGGKPSRGKGIAVAIIVAVVVIGVFAVVYSLFSNRTNEMQTTASATTVANGSAQATSAAGEDQSHDQIQYASTDNAQAVALSSVQVAQKARKSVVGVMTYVNGQLSGEGSGVVMSADTAKNISYIITCAHVISDKGVTYGVLTLEGKSYEAKLVAYDTRTDIGVLKVEASDLPVAEFGDSSILQVGEVVYAIGNPGGSDYFGSITDGIISAIDRSLNGSYNMTCIQHNAAINPGNSGGALVNSQGQVIGINSSKIADTDYEGMGFAVPMSIVKPVVESLISYGYVPNRPKLGIEYASVSDYQLYSLVVAIKGLPAGSLVIAGISNDSSLMNTNAQVGDLIIGVNGKKMDTSDVLLDLIGTGNVGDTLTLNLCRVDGKTYQTKEFDVTITLVEDKGNSGASEETTIPAGGYNYGGESSFDEFFDRYFGEYIR